MSSTPKDQPIKASVKAVPQKPKRPKNYFMLFRKDVVKQLKHNNPFKKFALSDYHRIAAEIWEISD